MLKMIDLFAWCWWLSLWMEQAGFHVIFANEINKTFFETYLYNRNLKEHEYFIGDINELNKDIGKYSKNWDNIDLVCWWPPCQWFSMANRQRIIDDPRNNLYKAYIIFLSNVRPKFFIMENVKWMAKKIDEITKDFKEYLWPEYTFSNSLLNAKNFGIPQNRERFFFIWTRLNIDVNKIFDELKEYNPSKKFLLKDALEDLPKLEPNRNKNQSSLENKSCGFSEIEYKYNYNQYYNFINNNRILKKLYNHKNRYNNDRDIKIFESLPQWGNSLHESIKDIMPYSSRNHIFKDKYYKLREDDVSKTITSHMKYDCNMYIHPQQARWLSPREAARIQTFPDDYVFRWTPNNWYAQIGNAVPVKLAEIIWQHIIKYLWNI